MDFISVLENSLRVECGNLRECSNEQIEKLEAYFEQSFEEPPQYNSHLFVSFEGWELKGTTVCVDVPTHGIHVRCVPFLENKTLSEILSGESENSIKKEEETSSSS